jgi:hypothetical protein
LRSEFVKLAFLFLGKTVINKEDRKFVVAPHVHHPRPAALAHALAGHANLPKPARPRHHIAALRVLCNHGHNVVTLRLAEEFASEGDVRRRFDNGLPFHLVLQWTP